MPPANPKPSRRLALAAEALLVALGFALVTAVVTWPQPALLGTHSHGHHDALFSMWRLSWIAHALSTPASLFDAPIFWPVTGTLAFSDAVLLQGLAAWPALAAGLPVLPVYNVLLLAGPWASALGAYLLARRLTGSRSGGLVAGLVFGFAPYRIEHAMHLELQWSQWMPLALWALHRTWSSGRFTDGALTGLCVLLQFLSCIYYGVFLALFLVLVTPVLWWRHGPARPTRVVLALVVGALLVAPALVAYAMPYRQSQAQLGGRSPEEIARWSATPSSYLSTPWENRLYGSWTWRLGASEARLFPGTVAIVLALVALWRPGRMVVVYAWGLVCAVVMSFGTNTPVYGLALAAIPPLGGLRAPARFAMLATLALAVLAGFGCARLLRNRPQWAQAAVGLVAAIAMTAEYASTFGPLHAWPQRAPMYANWLATQPRGVVLELPVPAAHALPLFEGEWSYLGMFHGHPLVNGYSGYFPRPYVDLLGALGGFPSDESLWALGKRDVRYVVLHEDRYPQGDFLELLGRIERYPCLERVGRFPDPAYPVSLYTLRTGC
jgi:hypothetical protein